MIQPQDVTWYIKAKDASGQFISEGTAVSIHLKKQGADQPPRTYLLTCAHVIRGQAEDNEDYFGKALGNIRGWRWKDGFRPEKPDSPGGGYALRPFLSAVPWDEDVPRLMSEKMMPLTGSSFLFPRIPDNQHPPVRWILRHVPLKKE